MSGHEINTDSETLQCQLINSFFPFYLSSSFSFLSRRKSFTIRKKLLPLLYQRPTNPFHHTPDDSWHCLIFQLGVSLSLRRDPRYNGIQFLYLRRVGLSFWLSYSCVSTGTRRIPRDRVYNPVLSPFPEKPPENNLRLPETLSPSCTLFYFWLCPYYHRLSLSK